MRLTGNYIHTSNYFVTNTASIYHDVGSHAYTLDTMEYWGAEAEFNWTPTDDLTIFGNYSFLKNTYDLPEDFPDAILLGLPPNNKGKISVKYQLPYRARIGTDIKIIGERSTEGGYTLDRYAVADISLDKKIAGRMDLGFYINNLFGMDYQQVYGYPSPGRTFGLRFKAYSRSESSID